MNQLLAQFKFDDIENYLFLVVIVLSVLGQVANSWIKSIKEKKEAQKERERRLRTGREDIAPKKPAFPVAKPRGGSATASPARPAPPVAKPRGPVVSPPQPPKRDVARPRIPDSVPEPIREFLGELVPELIDEKEDQRPQPEPARRPKPKPRPEKRARAAGGKPAPQRPTTTLKPKAPRGSLPPAPPIDAAIDLPGDAVDEVSDRLGTLTSAIGADVDANLGRLMSDPGSHYAILGQPMGHEHGYADYTAPKARFSPEALRQAVVYFEIFSKPKAIREEVDPF